MTSSKNLACRIFLSSGLISWDFLSLFLFFPSFKPDTNVSYFIPRRLCLIFNSFDLFPFFLGILLFNTSLWFFFVLADHRACGLALSYRVLNEHDLHAIGGTIVGMASKRETRAARFRAVHIRARWKRFLCKASRRDAAPRHCRRAALSSSSCVLNPV